MPYQSKFWRYVGADIGQARHYPFCWISPDDCHSKSESTKLFIGGKFNEAMGLEIGYVDTGTIHVAGGETGAYGLDFSLLGEMHVATDTSVVGRAGMIFGRSNVSGTAPGLVTAQRSTWNPSLGIGLQRRIASHWALRLDADRYRFRFSDGDHGKVDVLTVGLQYSFR